VGFWFNCNFFRAIEQGAAQKADQRVQRAMIVVEQFTGQTPQLIYPPHYTVVEFKTAASIRNRSSLKNTDPMAQIS